MRAPVSPPASGQVAFLLSDIEGSTALYERVGEEFRRAQGRHHELLRAEFERWGGYEFKETGDGFLVAFGNAADCLACAVAAQEALRAEAWPAATGPLRSRMALQWGEAVLEGGDYRGLTLHRASRVLSAAHGGQILCSEAFREALPPDPSYGFRELGLFRLRDLPQPQHLYQVGPAPAELPHFPPPRAAPAFTHNLPLHSTRFYGRERDLEQLVLRLLPKAAGGMTRGGGRLVTLLGPGGTGKTRLSLAVAEELLAAYHHAVWFVPLAALRQGDLLFETIRDALRLAPEASHSAREQLTAFLGAQPSLLILDNFEQLPAEAASAVGELLSALPLLACLVTSRRLLHLGGEIEYALPPLQSPRPHDPPGAVAASPSVLLFCDRATLARASFELTEENAADVAELCRALEGIPLALEIAAARINVLTPHQMRVKLTHRLDFLVSRRADLPERHRTLRATLEWSYELLSPELRERFAECSVFRGGWSLEAAEAVLAAGPGAPEPIDTLTELRECSLLVAEESGEQMRFRMLEMVREFAEAQLEPERRAATADRHHAFFLRLARASAALEESARLATYDLENENLRTLLAGRGTAVERAEVAVVLHGFWIARGFLAEGRAWLQQLTAADLDPVMSARLQHAAGILAWRAGDQAAAERHLQSALIAWEKLGRTRNMAAVWNNLGILANEAAQYGRAHEFYRRSLETFRQLGVASEIAAALSNLGENALQLGDLDEAGACLRESLALQRGLGEPSHIANTLHNLAYLHCQRTEWSEARHGLAECIQIRARLGDQQDAVAAFTILAQLAHGEGRMRLAATCLAAAEEARLQNSSAVTAAVAGQLALLREQVPAVEHAASGPRLSPEAVLSADASWKLSLD